MSKVVLDASALLALLNQEAGAQLLTPELLRDAAMSTVNLAEVQTKLVRDGVGPDEAWELAQAPISGAEPFTAEQAKIAGTLVKQTRTLSLADRACLALALSLRAPVYTADTDWKTLKLRVPIHILR